MPTTVNSRFLAIAAIQPNINVGWTLRVLDYKDMTSVVAIMSQYSEFSFTQQLNDTGTGSVTMDQDDAWWGLTLENGLPNRSILNHEYVFEAWENGVARFSWLGQTVATTLAADDENHKVTISGPGIAQVLTWGCIMRPGWPKKPPQVGLTPGGKPLLRSFSYSDMVPAFIWQFPMAWPSMRMWYTVLKAAQRRGVMPKVTPMFTPAVDSEKKPWKWIGTVQVIAEAHGYQPPELNENLLDFLNECTGQDFTKWFGQRLEWMMYPGFRLDVRTTIGTNRSKQVRFFGGQVISNERTRDREAIYNRVTAVDIDGTESVKLDANSVKVWNLREQRNETNKNVTDDTLRNELAARYLQQSHDEKSEWTIKIPYDDPERVPYRNFFVGDTIGFSDDVSGASLFTATDLYRIMAITISVGSDVLVPECELTLQSVIESKMGEIEKRITQLVNQPRNFDLDDLKTISIPAKPGVPSSLVYNPETKRWEAVPVDTTTATDTGGVHVYIQPLDPALTTGNTVATGDFWLKTV